MKVIDLYRMTKNKYPKFVILIKIGNFYEVYGEDAYIINNLFNYKIREFDKFIRAGFPLVSYNKVVNKLASFKINYLVIDKDDIFKKKFNRNRYDEFLSEDLSIEKRISKINERLNILKNSPKIDSVLKEIEKFV